MKPSKIRNRTMHHPSLALRSRLMASHLSKDLRKAHHTRNVRVVTGDSVTVLRGEYRSVSGRVDKVDPSRGVTIGGIKMEKPAGEKLDIYIHPSNLLVTALNLDDKRRAAKIKGHGSKSKDASLDKTKETHPTKPSIKAPQDGGQNAPREDTTAEPPGSPSDDARKGIKSPNGDEENT
ncbi:MAG: 50S ribosomal protein L24 [Nitrosopumilaceae archaeon]|nr:50S ribosomal protein L24 [Nitrosopumilaceae archaeon]